MRWSKSLSLKNLKSVLIHLTFYTKHPIFSPFFYAIFVAIGRVLGGGLQMLFWALKVDKEVDKECVRIRPTAFEFLNVCSPAYVP
jgi:hypothetical protein